jgi:N-methylhydantoinase B/oxoprolinase/acetone carboxylase alpha subunit
MPTLLSKMLASSPDADDLVSVMAPTSVTSGANYFGGFNQWGRFIADMNSIPLNTMGEGAKSQADGTNAWGFSWCPWGKALDVEHEENECPWIYLYLEHLPDSGGFGKYRGGASTTAPLMVYPPGQVAICSIGVSSKFALTPGLFGGYPACTFPGIVAKQTPLLAALSESPRDVPSSNAELVAAIKEGKLGEVELTHNVRFIQPIGPGEVHVMWSGAGGGYGDVLERDPERVVLDLAEHLITEWTADNVYKVVFDATGQADLEATARRRQDERQARKERGMPYEEFMDSWSTRMPPEQILEWFGGWPDGDQSPRFIVRM